MNSICLIVLKDYYRYIQFYKYSINMFWDTLVPNSSAVMSTDSTGVFFTATYSLFTVRTDSPTASYWSDTITRHSFAQRHKSWTCPHFSCSYGTTFIWIAKRMTWRHTHTHTSTHGRIFPLNDPAFSGVAVVVAVGARSCSKRWMAAAFQRDGGEGSRPWPGNVFNGSIECIPRVSVWRDPTHSRRWMASTNNYSGQLRPIIAEESHSKGFSQQKRPEMGEAFCPGHVRAFVWRDQIILKLIFVVALHGAVAAALVAATTWSPGHRTYVTVRKRYTSLY